VAQAELDLRLHRLIFLADGVYAIAMTLLAVDLFLPEATSQLRGDELLTSLVDRWPEVLAFVTSFTFIANFWVGHTMQFDFVRRFDGGLVWLALLQMMFVAFMPFPTSVVSKHTSDPVANLFYFGTIFLALVVMELMWWYISGHHRLVDRNLSSGIIRRVHRISLAAPISVFVLMALIAVGIGRIVTPLILGYAIAFAYVVLGIREGRDPIPALVTSAESSDERLSTSDADDDQVL
jgi:TMEM175 potassium channel family protein